MFVHSFGERGFPLLVRQMERSMKVHLVLVSHIPPAERRRTLVELACTTVVRPAVRQEPLSPRVVSPSHLFHATSWVSVSLTLTASFKQSRQDETEKRKETEILRFPSSVSQSTLQLTIKGAPCASHSLADEYNPASCRFENRPWVCLRGYGAFSSKEACCAGNFGVQGCQA